MLDDKKIEEAAYRFATSQKHGELLALIDGYKEGYKDAINEFLKDLWHPVSEEPRQKTMLLIEISLPKLTSRKSYYTDVLINEDWEIKRGVMYISRWLYVDDLLSKKGVGNDVP